MGNVREKVIMSYQGSRFRLGRGQSFVAIWPTGSPLEHPLEQWPATPDGWSAAWSRFTELEAPGTIASVSVDASDRPAAVPGFRVTNSSALLVIGVVFGAVGLFPAYWTGSSLISSAYLLVPHLLYLLVWAVAAVLVLLGGGRTRMGALLGAGTSVVTFGMFLADVGQSFSGGSSAGAGLILACIGWVACAAGSGLALRSVFAGSWRSLTGRPNGATGAVVALLALLAAGIAVTFVPAWDNVTFATSAGQITTSTSGDVFSQQWLMIVGDVIVMLAIVAAAALSGLLRPMRMGAVLLIGATVPIVAQAVSALIQSPELTSGWESQLRSAGETFISNGLTTWFWVYCLFAVALVVSCAWMLLTQPLSPLSSAATIAPPLGVSPPGFPTPDVVPSPETVPSSGPAPATAATESDRPSPS